MSGPFVEGANVDSQPWGGVPGHEWKEQRRRNLETWSKPELVARAIKTGLAGWAHHPRTWSREELVSAVIANEGAILAAQERKRAERERHYAGVMDTAAQRIAEQMLTPRERTYPNPED